MEWWHWLIILILAVLATAVATFFVTRKLFKRELEKNPPVTEAMIRAMFASMGRTASEKQIRAVMNSMKNSK